jgi:hypothetical protein
LNVAYGVSSLVEHELLTRLEHMSSSSVFSGFRVTRPLVFCVVFYRWLFFLSSFGYFVVLCSQIFAPTVQKLVLKGTGIHWRPIVLFCLFVLNAWEWEKLFPREIPLNRILIWLIHLHMYLCLKFFVNLFQCFERDCFVQ